MARRQTLAAPSRGFRHAAHLPLRVHARRLRLQHVHAGLLQPLQRPLDDCSASVRAQNTVLLRAHTSRTVEDLRSARHALDVLHALRRQRSANLPQQRQPTRSHLKHIAGRNERQPVARTQPRHQLARAANTWRGARASAQQQTSARSAHLQRQHRRRRSACAAGSSGVPKAQPHSPRALEAAAGCEVRRTTTRPHGTETARARRPSAVRRHGHARVSLCFGSRCLARVDADCAAQAHHAAGVA